jgi:hypothetical protein
MGLVDWSSLDNSNCAYPACLYPGHAMPQSYSFVHELGHPSASVRWLFDLSCYRSACIVYGVIVINYTCLSFHVLLSLGRSLCTTPVLLFPYRCQGRWLCDCELRSLYCPNTVDNSFPRTMIFPTTVKTISIG